MTTSPKFFAISMFPTVALQVEGVERLLDAFEAEPAFVPTHWGYDERSKIPYKREELLKQIASEERSFSAIWLHNNSRAQYSGSFTLKTGLFAFAELLFRQSLPQQQWPAFLALADSIAAVVQPSYGVAHMMYPSVVPWSTDEERLLRWLNFCVQPTPARVNPNGPLGLGHVTYLGAKLVQLLGEAYLAAGPFGIEKREGGGCKLLLPSPLEEPLLARQLDHWLAAMAYLGTRKVFAVPEFHRDCRSVSFRPNETWLNRKRYWSGELSHGDATPRD